MNDYELYEDLLRKHREQLAATSDKKIPPRVWLVETRKFTWAHSSKYINGGDEYLSLEEHEHLIREARAEVWEEASALASKHLPYIISLHETCGCGRQISEHFKKISEAEREQERSGDE